MSESSFKIIDNALWLDVLKILLKHIEDYSIVEFSRGVNSSNKTLQSLVYLDYFKIIESQLLDSNYIIIFLDFAYRKRYKRNLQRAKNGGHFVELETFDTIYKYSCCPKNSKNFIKISDSKNLNKLIKKIGGIYGIR